MHSPQPVVTSAPAANVRIVILAPQGAAGRPADLPVAANDGVLATPQGPAPPAAEAGQTPLMQVPLAIALAAVLWVVGTIVLLTLALAYRLLA